MNDTDRNGEQVRQLLRTAFEGVTCPYEEEACGPMLHEECLELRKDFYNLTPEQIQYDLPYLLEDLMDTRTGDDIETEDAEHLVAQLDPMFTNDPVIKEIKLAMFANFTREQSQAVCEWLRMARGWRDLSLYTSWVDGAIDYWCRRANGR